MEKTYIVKIIETDYATEEEEIGTMEIDCDVNSCDENPSFKDILGIAYRATLD